MNALRRPRVNISGRTLVIAVLAGLLMYMLAAAVFAAEGIVEPIAKGTGVEEILAALGVPIFVAVGAGSVIRNMLPTDNRWIPAVQLITGTAVALLWTGDYSGKGIIIGMVCGLAAHGARDTVAQTADRFKRPPDDDV